MRIKLYLLVILFVTTFAVVAQEIQPETTDLLPEFTFTDQIEGPATDDKGNIYAVNYGKDGTIGVVYPDGSSECFIVLPTGSIGNGIRFDKKGNMLVADYTGHNILQIDMTTRIVSVYVHEPTMNQPNDIALAPNGDIYASDPAWATNSGQIWLSTAPGSIQLLETNMGTTNGIEVSPDGKTLYVNESVQRKVWKYDIHPDGTVSNKTLFYQFEDHGMDGMRCDIKGNLYICRYGKGTVAILNPSGKLIKEIGLKGKKPSNITFGGADNQTCYITLQDRGSFERFEALHAGRE